MKDYWYGWVDGESVVAIIPVTKLECVFECEFLADTLLEMTD